MRVLNLAALTIPALLAACATTPRQQCEWPIQNQLGALRLEIADTQQIIRRGYRLVPAQYPYIGAFCVDHFGNDRLCFPGDEGVRMDRRPIHVRAERAKLEALLDERERLGRDLAECAVLYPEG